MISGRSAPELLQVGWLQASLRGKGFRRGERPFFQQHRLDVLRIHKSAPFLEH
jgi:hypothetical protein